MKEFSILLRSAKLERQHLMQFWGGHQPLSKEYSQHILNPSDRTEILCLNPSRLRVYSDQCHYLCFISVDAFQKARRKHQYTPLKSCSVGGGGCRIHLLLLYRRVRTLPPTSVLYMTLNNLTVRWMWSNPALPSLPGPLWLGLVALDKCSIYGSNTTKP